MSGALHSFAGGVGRIGSDVMHGNWGGALGEVGHDIMGAPGWLGSQFGSMFGGNSTGQPSSMTPSATPASMAQSTPTITAGGAAPTSAGGNLLQDVLGSSQMDNAALNLGGSNGLTDETINSILSLNGDYAKGGMTAPAGGGSAMPSGNQGGGIGGMLQQMAGGKPGEAFDLGNFIQRVAVPAGVMGYSIYRGNQPLPHQRELENLAGGNAATAQALQSQALAAMNGQLPGGAEAGIQQGLNAAQAAIRSKYANMGLSGSTMEGQDLANAEQAAVAMRFQIGQEMARTGLAGAGNANALASSLYDMIMQSMLQQGSQMGDALSAFAGALTH